MSFYQRKEIKDVMAYLRLVVNPNAEEALKRIINYPTRGIGDTTVAKIVATATTYGVSLWAVICQPTLFHLELSRGTAAKIEAFRQLVEGWASRCQNEDAYKLGHAIIMESGISKDIYSSRNPEDLSRQENLEEFLSGIQDFVESRKEEDQADHIYLSDFLQEVALLTDLDSDDNAEQPKVALMTIHSAKGLEFPTVFVVGLEENIFPSPMCTDSLRALEEERRLLYVAITRAEKHCILTCAQNRFRYGRMEYDTPSRFIRDIDPQLLYIVDNSSSDSAPDNYRRNTMPWYKRPSVSSSARSSNWMQNPRPVATQFRADPMPRAVAPRRPETPVNPFPNKDPKVPQTLRVGMTIEHQRFGIGTVKNVEGSGENEKATVEFRNVGTKQLLLKFAKYRVV
jgi:DNA helicase-2/ATP-dependent DNA helicase PcrA